MERWKEQAKRIPSWPGQQRKLLLGNVEIAVLVLHGAKRVQIDSSASWANLEDPDTALAAMHRLAEAEGMPAEALVHGITFVPVAEGRDQWVLVVHGHGARYLNCRLPITLPVHEALAAAWAARLDQDEATRAHEEKHRDTHYASEDAVRTRCGVALAELPAGHKTTSSLMDTTCPGCLRAVQAIIDAWNAKHTP